MNTKNIKKHLNGKMRDWINSIEDESVKTIIRQNAIVTGGAMVSLLTGEPVHDYDVYFRTKEACVTVAKYYVEQWNKLNPGDKVASLVVENDKTEMVRVVDHPGQPFSEENSKEIDVLIPGRVKVFIQSEGVVGVQRLQVDV